MTEFLDPFVRMLGDIASPAAIRDIEHGGSGDAMWAMLEASGFLDALLAEEDGGPGLSLADANPLWQALGRFAVPLPVGETMIARALLAKARIPAPGGPIALAVAAAGGAREAETLVLCGLVSRHVLVESAGALHLVEIASRARTGTGVFGSLAAYIPLGGFGEGGIGVMPQGGLRPLAAVLRAAQIAGAAERLTAMTAAYAGERVQFGKPIGRQQALQQDMAVMAVHSVAARIASQIGCSAGLPPPLEFASVAKVAASTAAARIAASAHAIHGAIGISEEHDLQLLTRRLHEWRLADGSEGYWSRELGRVRLSSGLHAVDFARSSLSAAIVDA